MVFDRLFVLSFKNSGNDLGRDCYDKCYMPLVEIKDFNIIIDHKPFFDQPVKNNYEAYGKLAEMSRNGHYTKGKQLVYLYHQNYYTIIGMIYQDQQIQHFTAN